eukprot:TRINITY_DN28280_c0_g1_i1.p1 TRINITY_DN28280_c0_g1~~TRINITY_DN28280_c0_g1_i1.p1  ORF type:complete len:480 (+),score=169.22 TRINITY_DN28280_c0_g1_i1:117-1556(+)
MSLHQAVRLLGPAAGRKCAAALRALRKDKGDAAAFDVLRRADHGWMSNAGVMYVCTVALLQGWSVTRALVALLKRPPADFHTKDLVRLARLCHTRTRYFEPVAECLEKAVERRGLPLHDGPLFVQMLTVALRRLKPRVLPHAAEVLMRTAAGGLKTGEVATLATRAARHRHAPLNDKRAVVCALLQAAGARPPGGAARLLWLAYGLGCERDVHGALQQLDAARLPLEDATKLLRSFLQKLPATHGGAALPPAPAYLLRSIERAAAAGAPLPAVLPALECLASQPVSSNLFRIVEDALGAAAPPRLTTDTASRLVVSYCAARCLSPPLLAQLEAAVALEDLTPPLACRYLHACAVAKTTSHALFRAADARLAPLRALSPSQLTGLLWSGAAVRVPMPATAARIDAGGYVGFDTRKLVTVAWALKKTGCAHDARRLQDALFRTPLPRWGDSDVSMAFHAVRELTPQHRAMLDAEHARRRRA